MSSLSLTFSQEPSKMKLFLSQKKKVTALSNSLKSLNNPSPLVLVSRRMAPILENLGSQLVEFLERMRSVSLGAGFELWKAYTFHSWLFPNEPPACTSRWELSVTPASLPSLHHHGLWLSGTVSPLNTFFHKVPPSWCSVIAVETQTHTVDF